MNFAKRLLMIAGAVALAAIVGVILTRKAAHGIVATMVQVVNPPSQPVPVADQDARNSFEIVLCVASPQPLGCPDNFTVPATTASAQPVERLVIEFVSFGCDAEARINLRSETGIVEGQPAPGIFFHTFSLTASANSGFAAATPVRIYADPGSTIKAEQFVGTLCFVNVSGHLVSQQL